MITKALVPKVCEDGICPSPYEWSVGTLLENSLDVLLTSSACAFLLKSGRPASHLMFAGERPDRWRTWVAHAEAELSHVIQQRLESQQCDQQWTWSRLGEDCVVVGTMRREPDYLIVLLYRAQQHEGSPGVEVKTVRSKSLVDIWTAVIEAAEICTFAQLSGHTLAYFGISGAFRQMADAVKRAAALADVAVLITGERGAGKESAAYGIHYHSMRREAPFLAINCAALSPDLCLSELFGHRKGAFTGALDDRKGKLQAAGSGTVLLDEITEAPPEVLSALLRVLEQGEVQILGHDGNFRVRARLLAATNRDIDALVRSNRFPADVYDRLNALRICVPPLRERREDITYLIAHYWRIYCRRCSIQCEREGRCHGCVRPECISPDVFRLLQDYLWPGNVRELKNTVASLVAATKGRDLELAALPAKVLTEPIEPSCENALRLSTVLKRHISTVLWNNNWNKSAAARQLGLPLSTLVSMLKRYRINQSCTSPAPAKQDL